MAAESVLGDERRQGWSRQNGATKPMSVRWPCRVSIDAGSWPGSRRSPYHRCVIAHIASSVTIAPSPFHASSDRRNRMVLHVKTMSSHQCRAGTAN